MLAGFRGTDPGELWKFEEALCERPHFAVLYRSNQHTGVHLQAQEPKIYRSVDLVVSVRSSPLKLPGGHVIVEVSDGVNIYDAAFYEDSGPLARAAEDLYPGDVINIAGGVRPYSPRGKLTISVEAMKVVSIAQRYVRVPPRCPSCGARMESLGKGKGYRCPRCGLRLGSAQKQSLVVERELMPGSYYYKAGRARHLSPVGVRLPTLSGLPITLNISDVLRVF